MENDIKDVNYEELNDEKSKKIRGKILYYMPGQVATILNQHFPDLKDPISESKVRFYTRTFGNLLGEEALNKPSRFIEQDIEKFKFIIELKESGMSLKQIQEYCEHVSFDESTGIQIKESNPLSIKSLATALLDEQNNQLQKFKKELLGELDNKLKQYLIFQAEENVKVAENLKQEVAIAVDEVVSEKLENELTNFKTYITEKEQRNQETQQEHLQIFTDSLTGMIQEHENKIDNTLNEFLSLSRMERKEVLEKHRKENNIFYRFFSKFKKSKEENEIINIKESKEDK